MFSTIYRRFTPVFLPILLAATCGFLAFLAQGQSAIRLKQYSTANGLSQGTIYSMLHDSRGFMWFGTWDGLNRFDGYEFLPFTPNPADPHAIGGNHIISILEDKTGNLWVGTNEALNLYDYRRQHFTQFFLHENGIKKKGDYRAFYIDDKDQIWINYNQEFICVFNIRSKKFEILEYTRNKLGYREITNNNHQYFKPVKNIYVAGKGITIIDVVNKNINNRFQQADIQKATGNAEMKAIFADADTLWVASFKGIVELQLNTRKCFLYQTDNDGKKVSGLSNIIPYNKDLFWIGSYGSGVYLFDKNKRKVTRHIQKNDLQKEGLAENIVDEMYTDRDGNHWLSVEPSGVNMYNPTLVQFNTIRFSNNIVGGAKNNSAQGITLLDSHTALVSFYQSGILKYNLETGAQKIVQLPRQDEEITAQTFYTHSNGQVWAGTDYGLFYSNKGGENFRAFTSIKAMDFYDMWQFCRVNDGAFLTGNSRGLQLMQYLPCKAVPVANLLSKDTIVALAQYRDSLFAAVNSHGNILLFTLRGQKLEVQKKCSFSQEIKQVEFENHEKVWISTSAGIIVKNVTSNDEKIINEKNGLSNSFIYAVLRGNDSCMWASSNNGLERISLKDYSVQHYNSSSGVQGKEFNTGAWYRAENGWLYFGGTNGANYFNPAAVSVPLFDAPLQMMQVLVNDRALYDSSAGYNERYELHYNDNNIFLSFTAVDFNRTDDIVYSYSLNNDAWLNIGNERNLRLLNLAPGNYEIRIKAGLHSGQESSHQLQIAFTILPPWYKTTLAYVMFTLLFAALVFLVIRFSLRYKLEQQKRLIEKKEAVIQERERIIADLHDDVGGGLSAIRMVSDLMQQQTADQHSTMHFAQKISLTARDIAQRMNAIIWSLNAENDTLGNLTEYIRQYGFNFFEDSGIHFHFEANHLSPSIELNGIQRKNLFLITKEAFNNIVRHAQATKASLLINIQDHYLVLEIADDGRGIQSLSAFGNGLKNMRKRMQEINGTVDFSNECGTKIRLSLKITQ